MQASARLGDEWLLEGGEAVFAVDPSALADTYQLRVGDRPYARSLRTLFKLREIKYPPELAALPGEVYAIVHAVGMFVPEGRLNRIDAIGYRAGFNDRGTTVDLLPAPKFRQWASLGINGNVNVGMSADGSIKAPAELTSLLTSLAPIPLSAEAELRVGGSATMVGNLSLRLQMQTLEIQAVGQASSEVIWQFRRTDKPLIGDQVMVQTVVVPSKQAVLDFEIQATTTIDPGVFHRPIRLDSPLVRVAVELPIPT
jgi:hypothetical protein